MASDDKVMTYLGHCRNCDAVFAMIIDDGRMNKNVSEFCREIIYESNGYISRVTVDDARQSFGPCDCHKTIRVHHPCGNSGKNDDGSKCEGCFGTGFVNLAGSKVTAVDITNWWVKDDA